MALFSLVPIPGCALKLGRVGQEEVKMEWKSIVKSVAITAAALAVIAFVAKRVPALGDYFRI